MVRLWCRGAPHQKHSNNSVRELRSRKPGMKRHCHPPEVASAKVRACDVEVVTQPSRSTRHVCIVTLLSCVSIATCSDATCLLVRSTKICPDRNRLELRARDDDRVLAWSDGLTMNGLGSARNGADAFIQPRISTMRVMPFLQVAHCLSRLSLTVAWV